MAGCVINAALSDPHLRPPAGRKRSGTGTPQCDVHTRTSICFTTAAKGLSSLGCSLPVWIHRCHLPLFPPTIQFTLQPDEGRRTGKHLYFLIPPHTPDVRFGVGVWADPPIDGKRAYSVTFNGYYLCHVTMRCAGMQLVLLSRSGAVLSTAGLSDSQMLCVCVCV